MDDMNHNKPIAILDQKFYLMTKLGKGSTSSVYLGYSLNDVDGKPFAFKTINPCKIDNAMFEREVKMHNLIKHDNVLQIYAHGKGELRKANGKTKELYYIVLEYLEHGELLDLIYLTKGFGEDYGRIIASSLLDAVEAVHDAGIVHRDIKADNIMLGQDFNIKLLDFGFATFKSQGKLHTYLGTPNYAAPELLLQTPYYGICNDIFSLGVTIFVIVTGALPFKLATPNDSLYGSFFQNNYNDFWKKRAMDLSDSFIELFNNIFAFDFTQRPSISEIKISKWMRDLNWQLIPELHEEFQRRLMIIKQEKEKDLRKKSATAKKMCITKSLGRKVYKACSIDLHSLILLSKDDKRCGKYTMTFKTGGKEQLDNTINCIYTHILNFFQQLNFSIEINDTMDKITLKHKQLEVKVKIGKANNDEYILYEMKRVKGLKEDFIKIYSKILKN